MTYTVSSGTLNSSIPYHSFSHTMPIYKFSCEPICNFLCHLTNRRKACTHTHWKTDTQKDCIDSIILHGRCNKSFDHSCTQQKIKRLDIHFDTCTENILLSRSDVVIVLLTACVKVLSSYRHDIGLVLTLHKTDVEKARRITNIFQTN